MTRNNVASKMRSFEDSADENDSLTSNSDIAPGYHASSDSDEEFDGEAHDFEHDKSDDDEDDEVFENFDDDKAGSNASDENKEETNEKKALTAEEKSRKRKEQKDLKVDRKKVKKNSSVIDRIKDIWNKIREKKLSEPERETLMKEVMVLIKGKIKEVILKHDASRVVQTLIKHGNKEQRTEIAKELQGEYAELSKSVYGKYIIVKLLKYCSEMRNIIIKEFYGNVVKLMKNKQSAHVIEEIYSMYCNAQQKTLLIEEFYGREFSLFKKLDRKLTLKSIIETKPERKSKIMEELSFLLLGLLNKQNIQHSIIHKAMLEYLTLADEKQIQGILNSSSIKDQLAEVLHTKEGYQVAMILLGAASSKDRKGIIKSFKPFLLKIFQEEYGHVVIIFALMVHDDTVLLSKVLCKELIQNMSVAMKDKYSRNILLYLASGKMIPQIFSQHVIKMLNELKGKSMVKKDEEKKASELFNFMKSDICKGLLNLKEAILTDKHISFILIEMLTKLNSANEEEEMDMNAKLRLDLVNNIIYLIKNNKELLCSSVSAIPIRKCMTVDSDLSKLVLNYSLENLPDMIDSDAIHVLINLAKIFPSEMKTALVPYMDKQLSGNDSKKNMLKDLIK